MSGVLSLARIKLNRETKNFSRYVYNLRLMETSLKFGVQNAVEADLLQVDSKRPHD